MGLLTATHMPPVPAPPRVALAGLARFRAPPQGASAYHAASIRCTATPSRDGARPLPARAGHAACRRARRRCLPLETVADVWHYKALRYQSGSARGTLRIASSSACAAAEVAMKTLLYTLPLAIATAFAGSI